MLLEGSGGCLFFHQLGFVYGWGYTPLKIDFRVVSERFTRYSGSISFEDVFFELGVLPEVFRLRFSKIFGREVWGFGGLCIFD
jgi:hypothetical protein